MQFKSFMQGLSAPQAPMAPPMAPQMMPMMPQIPPQMQNIDVFAQPVQYMARGGVLNRPVSTGSRDSVARRAAGEAAAKRIFSKPKREKDDDKEDRARRTVKITPQQEEAARSELTRRIIENAGGEGTARYNDVFDTINSFTPRQSNRGTSLSDQIASLRYVRGRSPIDSQGMGFEDDIPSERSMLGIDPRQSGLGSTLSEQIARLRNVQGSNSGLTNVDSMPMVAQVYDPISELDAEDGPPVDPRRSGLGSTLSQQIAALSRDELPTFPEIGGIDFEDVPDDETFLPITATPQDVNLLADSFLTKLPFGIGSYIADNQMDQLGTFMNIPGSQYDYELGKGVAPAGQFGSLSLSPSGVVTYSGPRDANYTGPFANLVNPPPKQDRDVNPCPPGYTLVNGACMPISQPIAQATPATPAPNVISNIPVTTAAPSPVVQSTAPPAQLGMPLGQPTPIQPMNQFLTNIPNSLNLAANNFLSALSS
jgi:hypothetical protein